MMPGRAGKKLVGFGLSLRDWTWMGTPPRDFDPGDIKWISEEEFWYLKTMWPDCIFDLTPKNVGLLP
jgi:hypothetical protein